MTTKILRVFGIICAALILISLIFFLVQRRGSRRSFEFQTVGTEQPVLEFRPVAAGAEDPVVFYVNELLLGPQTPRARPLFSRGTVSEFCFLRDHELFVGLSKDVLYEIPDASKISDGIALFVKNVRKNFPQVKKVSLFIDGKSVEMD